jgi:hypothetical protein
MYRGKLVVTTGTRPQSVAVELHYPPSNHKFPDSLLRMRRHMQEMVGTSKFASCSDLIGELKLVLAKCQFQVRALPPCLLGKTVA